MKAYLAAHRQEGTRRDFDVSREELKTVVVSLDGEHLPASGMFFNVKPREGERDSFEVDNPIGYPANCIVDVVAPKFTGVGRAGLKVICVNQYGASDTWETIVLDAIARKISGAKTQTPISVSSGLGKEELSTAVQAAVKGALAAQNSEAASQPIASDVDNPKYHQNENADRFAVVIGIEKYQNLPQAKFANRDAAAVRAHLLALGVPQRNIFFAADQDATRAGLVKAVHTWLPNRVTEKSTVYFYYSGHGAPDPESHEGYLVPIDGDPEALADTAYSLKSLYHNLSQLKAGQVIVALDSCFSGAGGRSVLAAGTRPMVTVINKPTTAGNIITLSASKSDQISGMMDDQGHGTFTYYFLAGLNGGAVKEDGSVTVQTLYNYLKPKVADAARLRNRDQTPELDVGSSLSADLKLR